MGLPEVGIAVWKPELGMVAWAAGPSAADRGVAGSGEVNGEGPCKRSKPGYADAEGNDDAESGCCTAGADVMTGGEVCMRKS